jgi:hypothetical protein
MENSVLPILLPMKEQFIMDSITMIATSTVRQKTRCFKSPFLNAEIEGNTSLTIPDAITNSFSTYYNPTPSVNQLPPQSSSDSNTISDSPILVKFIPELKSLEPISFLRSLRHGQ